MREFLIYGGGKKSIFCDKYVLSSHSLIFGTAYSFSPLKQGSPFCQCLRQEEFSIAYSSTSEWHVLFILRVFTLMHLALQLISPAFSFQAAVRGRLGISSLSE